jgi:hypothetical protein
LRVGDDGRDVGRGGRLSSALARSRGKGGGRVSAGFPAREVGCARLRGDRRPCGGCDLEPKLNALRRAIACSSRALSTGVAGVVITSWNENAGALLLSCSSVGVASGTWLESKAGRSNISGRCTGGAAGKENEAMDESLRWCRLALRLWARGGADSNVGMSSASSGELLRGCPRRGMALRLSTIPPVVNGGDVAEGTPVRDARNCLSCDVSDASCTHAHTHWISPFSLRSRPALYERPYQQLRTWWVIRKYVADGEACGGARGGVDRREGGRGVKRGRAMGVRVRYEVTSDNGQMRER